MTRYKALVIEGEVLHPGHDAATQDVYLASEVDAELDKPQCPRCLKRLDGTEHTCTPTPEWLAMEERASQNSSMLKSELERVTQMVSKRDAELAQKDAAIGELIEALKKTLNAACYQNGIMPDDNENALDLLAKHGGGK